MSVQLYHVIFDQLRQIARPDAINTTILAVGLWHLVDKLTASAFVRYWHLADVLG